MKKIYLTLALIMTLGLSNCQKEKESSIDFLDVVSQADLNLVKSFHEDLMVNYDPQSSLPTVSSSGKKKKKQFLLPDYSRAKQRKLFNGATAISMESDFEISNDKIGFFRSFVFLKGEGGRISYGRIVEIYGKPDFVRKNKYKILADYNKPRIEGFTGAILTYDIYYRPLRNRCYSNGKITNSISGIVRKNDHGVLTP